MHLVCEADSAGALSRGVQKITISLARLLNADGVREAGGSLNPRGGSFRERKGWIGKVCRDRYHAHVLESEREMSLTLDYLFHNAENHFGSNSPATFDLRTPGGSVVRVSIDLFTSFADLQCPFWIEVDHPFCSNLTTAKLPKSTLRSVSDVGAGFF
jgi:hypothetical protein